MALVETNQKRLEGGICHDILNKVLVFVFDFEAVGKVGKEGFNTLQVVSILNYSLVNYISAPLHLHRYLLGYESDSRVLSQYQYPSSKFEIFGDFFVGHWPSVFNECCNE